MFPFSYCLFIKILIFYFSYFRSYFFFHDYDSSVSLINLADLSDIIYLIICLLIHFFKEIKIIYRTHVLYYKKIKTQCVKKYTND